MKCILTIAAMLFLLPVFAQQKIVGIWEGKLNAGVSLRIVFEFNENKNGGISGTLSSPDQSPKALATDTAYTSGDSIYVVAQKFGISFSGQLVNDSTINGTFLQGAAFPLVLTKVAAVKATKRPQTPMPPFPYNSREVEYYNADRSVKFAGTLTYPAIKPGTDTAGKPRFATIMLITGSGPQDRDENILLHKPFAVLADKLTRQGFAVLRVDDRGVGKTTGVFATATSAGFANDVEAGIDYLKTLSEVDSTRLGLMGHSEGGMIAPMVASKRKDVKFIVMLAGPGVKITQLMAEQIYKTSIAEGNSEAVSRLGRRLYEQAAFAVLNLKDTAAMRKKIVEQITLDYPANKILYDSLELNTPENQNSYASGRIKSMLAPWYRYFVAFDPAPYLQKLFCDVLALNGEKDVQVLPASNLAGIRAALKKSNSKNYKVEQVAGLNHLFQTCKTCSPAEYGELEETFSPVALGIITEWLRSQL